MNDPAILVIPQTQDVLNCQIKLERWSRVLQEDSLWFVRGQNFIVESTWEKDQPTNHLNDVKTLL